MPNPAGEPDHAHTELAVAMEERAHRIVAKVLDADTGMVIREIPPGNAERAPEALPFRTGVFLDELSL